MPIAGTGTITDFMHASDVIDVNADDAGTGKHLRQLRHHAPGAANDFHLQRPN